jgi:hypothetical protein
MESLYHNHSKQYLKYIIILLGTVLVLLGIIFYLQYRHLQRLQVVNYRELKLSSLTKRAPLTENDVGIVESWMTFDYINRAFGMPRDYLQNLLKITDPRYPQLTLYRYAKNGNLDAAVFVNEVKAALTDYLTKKK